MCCACTSHACQFAQDGRINSHKLTPKCKELILKLSIKHDEGSRLIISAGDFNVNRKATTHTIAHMQISSWTPAAIHVWCCSSILDQPSASSTDDNVVLAACTAGIAGYAPAGVSDTVCAYGTAVFDGVGPCDVCTALPGVPLRLEILELLQLWVELIIWLS